MMKTGIELIAIERKEQIEKHKHTVEKDLDNNMNGELLDVATRLISDNNMNRFPANWNWNYCFRLVKKNKIERLTIAGALIAAEIDRLQNT